MKLALRCACGDEFFKFPSQIRKRNFCSPKCRCANQPKKGLAGTVEVCVCGKGFYVEPGRKLEGKGKFCSLKCKRENMTRRSGLKYVLKVVNPTWFKPGEKEAHAHQFPKGVRPHNFKIEGVGYDSLHDWVRRHKGKPQKCERCPRKTNLHWANKSWEYRRDLDDWMSLCAKCHQAYDRNGAWGAATAKFPELQSRKRA